MEELQQYTPPVITKVYSADGQVLYDFAQQRRVVVPGEKIPQHMRDAVMAIEDSRFRNHWGFSPFDFARAMVIDIIRMDFSQGASTLTQQLARILYEKIDFNKTISRKIKELIVALKLEQMYTKDEIINMYLNSSYLGGAYGIEEAAKRFFDKHAEEMTVAECAHLAGMIQTARYSPWASDPTPGFRRRNYVLSRMRELNFITEEEYTLAKNSPITFPARKDKINNAPYFVEDVRRKIQREKKSLGVDLYKDGLSIYTTLDTRLQKIAEEEFQKHINTIQASLNRRLIARPQELREIIKDTTVTLREVQEMIRGERPMKKSLQYHLLVQGAFIALDPKTGHIQAMVGGRNYEDSEFNRATQAERQPGSVFKPIVYGTAIDNGHPVTTILMDQPVTIMDNGKRWTPDNYNGVFTGKMTMREGIRNSTNTIAVRIVKELIDPKAVVQTAKQLHFTSRIPEVPSIALGVGGVKPIEVAAAYGTFQNHGVWVKPHSITKIVDRFGNIVKDYVPEKELVMSEATCFMITSLLRTVVREGTGKSSRWKYHFNHNAAGKTGTTSDWTDAWFSGYTPYIVATVYVGVDDPNVKLGRQYSGATGALPIWANFMRRTYEITQWPDEEFVQPDDVIKLNICNESKKLPSKYCTDVTSEYFIKGTEPTEKCPIHSFGNNSNSEIDDIIF
jgi:penicillin-binding protein 1A